MFSFVPNSSQSGILDHIISFPLDLRSWPSTVDVTMVLLRFDRPLSQQDAKKLVEKISEDNGSVDESKLDGIESQLRYYVLDTISKKDRMIGSSVIT